MVLRAQWRGQSPTPMHTLATERLGKEKLDAAVLRLKGPVCHAAVIA